MTNRFFYAFFTLTLCIICFARSVYAQITINGRPTSNPKVFFQGVNGNQELSRQIFSDLQFCGWFDIENDAKKANYVVTGNSSGGGVSLQVSNSAGVPVCTIQQRGENVRETAHKAVDGILKELFSIKGLCNTKIVFVTEMSDGTREIFISDFDGGNIRQITKNKTHSIEPVWSPDGKTIVYVFYGSSYTNLVQYNLATGLSRRLTSYPGLNAGGTLSPGGGHKTALVLALNNQVDLYVRETEGSKLNRITSDKSVEASPCWSPDGKLLCFVSDMTGRPALYLVSASGNEKPRMIRGISGSERVSPDWSSDGKIAYSAKINKDYVLAIAEIKDGSVKQIPVGHSGEGIKIPGEGPSWAPDNRHVVLENNGTIYIVDTFLGKTRKLFGGKSRVHEPDWSPVLP